jgi:hypothetical protein
VEVVLLGDVAEFLGAIEEDELGAGGDYFGAGDLDGGEFCFPVGGVIDIDPLDFVFELFVV